MRILTEESELYKNSNEYQEKEWNKVTNVGGRSTNQLHLLGRKRINVIILISWDRN